MKNIKSFNQLNEEIEDQPLSNPNSPSFQKNKDNKHLKMVVTGPTNKNVTYSEDEVKNLCYNAMFELLDTHIPNSKDVFKEWWDKNKK